MAYTKIEHRQTVDYTITGEQPVTQPYSASGARIDPRSLRVTVYNGQVEVVWVFGVRYLSTGKLGKATHSFPLSQQSAPDWVNQILAELGLGWPLNEDEDEILAEIGSGQ
jgi:hypothetical protein